MIADVVVFSPARIMDKSEFTNPHQYSVGIRDLMINGEFVLRDEKLTGVHGRFLRTCAELVLCNLRTP